MEYINIIYLKESIDRKAESVPRPSTVYIGQQGRFGKTMHHIYRSVALFSHTSTAQS
jgi:hypothetical protein